ncbi:MAG: peptidoglycan-binding domain-containing protein [Paracoccus sp. (in: a-proteobacteria)]|nr:peptidoglycan-binding domain-containing protein [Paracoccus sp. (in: a-proteobacteria)]
MGRIAGLMLGVAGMVLPSVAAAEEVFIRIEARRGAADAAEGAQALAAQFDNVVSYALPGGTWHAIAVGPLPRDEAQARLDAMKAARQVPQDAFLTPAEGISATPAGGGAPIEVASGGAADEATATDAAPPAEPEAPPPPPDYYLRLAPIEDEAEARAELTRLRETFPETGLWQSEAGYAIALGPLPEASARAWRDALANGEALPDDTETVEAATLGRAIEPGSAPDLPAPPTEPAAMPPLDEAQEALAWEGFYEGEIDGQDGPQTRAAIARMISTYRASTDPGTALADLAERRIAWRSDMGLETLEDAHTGLSLTAPMERLEHDRTERGMSIYGPRDGSGAALILFAQPGGQQEMLDMAGLVTALGWVPQPERRVSRGRVTLAGADDAHSGHAEARVEGDLVEGWVLIWPASDALNAERLAGEIRDSFSRHAPTRAELDAAAEADRAAEAERAAQDQPDAEEGAVNEAQADTDTPAAP